MSSSITALGLTGSSNALYINNTTGFMGIGKSNATCALDVVGTINASSNISIGGQSLTGLGVETQVVLTSGTSTWTVPTGVTNIKIIGTAGGGGGGSTADYNSGAGGGAGATQIWCGSVTPGQVLTYTVGAGGSGGGGTNAAGTAGGNTTVTYSTQTYILVNGGGGGKAPGTYSIAGGLGGTCGTALAQINVSGGDGQTTNLVGTYRPGTNGGPSYWGGGTSGGNGDYLNNGYNAATYGAGGGGGRFGGAGGSGAPGVVIITYFSASGLPAQYTATAPLSMSGTTLSIANATTSAPGVVQVGGGLYISNGIASTAQASYYFFGGIYNQQPGSPAVQVVAFGNVSVGTDVSTTPYVSNGFTVASTTTTFPGIQLGTANTVAGNINLTAGVWQILVNWSNPNAQTVGAGGVFPYMEVYNATTTTIICRQGYSISNSYENPVPNSISCLVAPTANNTYNVRCYYGGTIPQIASVACFGYITILRIA